MCVGLCVVAVRRKIHEEIRAHHIIIIIIRGVSEVETPLPLRVRLEKGGGSKKNGNYFIGKTAVCPPRIVLRKISKAIVIFEKKKYIELKLEQI